MSSPLLAMRSLSPHLTFPRNLKTEKISGKFVSKTRLQSRKIGGRVLCSSIDLELKTNNDLSSNIIAVEKDLMECSTIGKLSSVANNTHQGIGIINFCSGKKLLITGATGFLAKAKYTERLMCIYILRTMPKVDKIFVIIKAKNREAAMERLMKEIVDAELFKCLREEHGESYEAFVLSKLVPVVGNVAQPNIGIEHDLAHKIANEVDVIISSAANTTFDQRLDVSLQVNTQGARQMTDFAKKCSKLKLYVHISTAYVGRRMEGKVMEKAFHNENYKSAPDLDVEAELKFALEMNKSIQDNEKAAKMKELGFTRAEKYGWSNTYEYTKSLGEMVLEETRGELPVIIVRPSVVESTFQQPFPGWIEGSKVLEPVLIWYGKGKLPGLAATPSVILDVIPVDMVANATLAAIAKHGSRTNEVADKDNHVYQITSSVANPLTFGYLFNLVTRHFKSNPCFDSKGNPIQVRDFKLSPTIEKLLSHMDDDNSSIANEKTEEMYTKKEKLVRRKTKENVEYLASIYEPYTFYRGRLDNSNVEKLLKELSEEEKKEFGFDVRSIDWKEYIQNVHIPGVRKHVMKERVPKQI